MDSVKQNTPFTFLNILRSFRPINLLVIGATQFIIYQFYFTQEAICPFLGLKGYLLLPFILTTMLIAACGYLINDFFDFKGDLINKKKYKLSNPVVYLKIYFTLLILGFVISLWIALELGNPFLALIYILANAVLFLYSSHLKSVPFIGNIIVSLFSAFVILILVIFEFDYITCVFEFDDALAKFNLKTILFYSIFAFFISLSREIIKDMEDVEGDKKMDVKTMATIHGIKISKSYASLFLFFNIGLSASWIYQLNGLVETSLIILPILLLILPQIVLLVFLTKAKVKTDFSKNSFLAKVCMLLGLICFTLYTL
ncbi:MAG: UbiA family prenyltransferase [Saprospiraceae bacterium]|nr:UbiA family prenyltransferase [Saprospiraceae bacterium]